MSNNPFSRINIPEDPPNSPSTLAIAILFVVAPPITTMISLYLAYKRVQNKKKRKRYQQYRRYASVIGNQTKVSIRSIAATLGMPTNIVAQELQDMIDEGFIEGNPYIDHSHMTLYLTTADTVETDFVENVVKPIVNVFVNAEDRANTVAAAKATQAKQAKQAHAEPEAPVEEPLPKRERQPQPVKKSTDSDNFEAKLREIRELNEAIKDPGVSERIDRIGELTASIFRVVQEKPEHTDEVRRFMNYYLPTTLKLLKSYSLMEKQSYQGENIQASRKRIEEVLDTLVRAFEQQQDRLFRTEALDVEADISVLETMMASDGLLEKQGGLHVSGGKG